MPSLLVNSNKNLPNSPVELDRNFQSESNAFLAITSNFGSPISLPKIPNSSSKVPTPAVHVSSEQSFGMPCFRLT